jgi:hypothetical protein
MHPVDQRDGTTMTGIKFANADILSAKTMAMSEARIHTE